MAADVYRGEDTRARALHMLCAYLLLPMFAVFAAAPWPLSEETIEDDWGYESWTSPARAWCALVALLALWGALKLLRPTPQYQLEIDGAEIRWTDPHGRGRTVFRADAYSTTSDRVYLRFEPAPDKPIRDIDISTFDTTAVAESLRRHGWNLQSRG